MAKAAILALSRDAAHEWVRPCESARFRSFGPRKALLQALSVRKCGPADAPSKGALPCASVRQCTLIKCPETGEKQAFRGDLRSYATKAWMPREEYNGSFAIFRRSPQNMEILADTVG